MQTKTKIKHPLLLAHLLNKQWAMDEDAFTRIVSVLEGSDLDESDVTLFHHSSETVEARTSSLFGDPTAEKHYSSRDGDVGFLFLSGPIIPRATAYSNSSGVTSLDTATAELKALQADPTINKIGLVLDSPGGDVMGVADFSRLVAASPKPVHTFAYLAASAGYWIGSAGKTVSLSPTGMVGSVGAMISARLSDDQTSIAIVSRQSPKKNLSIKTPEGKAARQEVADDLAAVFISDVAKFRGVDEEKVLSDFGQGGVMVGERALMAGMVDSVQTADQWIAWLKSPTMDRATGQAREVFLGKEAEAKTPVENPASGMGDQTSALFERMQAIEALADQFEGKSQEVREAVSAKIKVLKYDPDMTVNRAKVAIMDTVESVQAKAFDAYVSGKREAGTNIAPAIGTGDTATDTGEDAAKKAKAEEDALIAGLVAHRKEAFAMSGGN